jgi:ribose 5-phosphate isomerase
MVKLPAMAYQRRGGKLLLERSLPALAQRLIAIANDSKGVERLG